MRDGPRGRDGGPPRDKRGPGREDRRPKHGRPGRERDDFGKKAPPKLHKLESVVDRGFDDVPDPANEGATRRVDWVILKQTTVDQNTSRPMAMVYLVRRDGTDTEFAQLSAARAAVNKTIRHPEKLTLSKADHAAARVSGKK